MKECTIIVQKVYETKRSRTITGHSVKLSEEALAELCTLVSGYFFSFKNSSLRRLCEALKDL